MEAIEKEAVAAVYEAANQMQCNPRKIIEFLNSGGLRLAHSALLGAFTMFNDGAGSGAEERAKGIIQQADKNKDADIVTAKEIEELLTDRFVGSAVTFVVDESDDNHAMLELLITGEETPVLDCVEDVKVLCGAEMQWWIDREDKSIIAVLPVCAASGDLLPTWSAVISKLRGNEEPTPENSPTRITF